ncbi:MAG: tRNA threonylcarbamoyladenosine dehydratase [Christensenellales bacterium]|jgi:tRNA A37 threonylcarbamoyladenosine dehydratase
MEQRTVLLIGKDAAHMLSKSHVAVLGVGGVGCQCIEALVRAGVGRITAIDRDVFEESNLNRQLYATRETLGKSKARAAADRAALINPSCHVNALDESISGENVAELIAGEIDYVCDAIDDINAKVAVAKHCAVNSIPLISCMGAGNRIGTGQFSVMDIFKTSYDPLAKIMRKKLREAGINKLEVCASSEEPYLRAARPPASISFVPPMAGLTMAGHVIRALAKV